MGSYCEMAAGAAGSLVFLQVETPSELLQEACLSLVSGLTKLRQHLWPDAYCWFS